MPTDPAPDPIDAALEALRTSLAAALPGRIVTRAFLPLSMRAREDLLAGVVCVVALGERDFANYRGREADLGTLGAVLVGQLQVDSDDPQDVERAELTLARQIKAWLADPMPAPVRQCLADGWRQSGQLEAPGGWVVFELEILT